MSQRIATDKTFRCIDEATVYAGATSHAFKVAYYYNIDRTYAGYDPNNLGASGLASGPVTPGYPNGNPHLPYFRLHGADVGFTYGNQDPLRDASDLKALQLMSGYFAAFTRQGDPNPSSKYLQVRGYTNVSCSFLPKVGTFAHITMCRPPRASNSQARGSLSAETRARLRTLTSLRRQLTSPTSSSARS